MTRFLRIITAILLATLMATQLPVQVFADSTSEKYISSITLGVGKKAQDALAALEGYEILKDDSGNYVDLNNDAGGGVGSKGNRVVYLGYMTTSDKSKAITDLAVMNMKGGYSIEDYTDLMEKHVKEQLIPFVDGFLAAIEEYRANYNSSNKLNKAKAQAVHDALNLLLDDDCDYAGLGDLLLNETKYEMGDAAYNALSEEEKKQHADILTIIAQSNGKATLIMENLITRASDTNDDTWVDRFLATSLDDLMDETNLSPSKAKAQLGRLYSDDAMKLLDMWDAFQEVLGGFETSAEVYSEAADTEIEYSGIDYETKSIMDCTDEQIEDIANEQVQLGNTLDEMSTCYTNMAVDVFLENIKYEDGTLYDFFMQDREDIEDDITVLYPIIAALSDGQRAGLEFLTFEDLFAFAMTDENGYKEFDMDITGPTSIYLGVDREIYESDAVALTSDALRAGKTGYEDIESPQRSLALSTWSKVFIGLSAASAVGVATSLAISKRLSYVNTLIDAKIKEIVSNKLWTYRREIYQLSEAIEGKMKEISSWEANLAQARAQTYYGNAWDQEYIALFSTDKELAALELQQQQVVKEFEGKVATLNKDFTEITEKYNAIKIQQAQAEAQAYEQLEITSREAKIQSNNSYQSTAKKLAIGGTILTIVMVAVMTYMIYRDFKAMKDKYKVDFTPAPRYIVDEKDITAYNAKGEKIVIKNQGAYYKAIRCNRTSGDYYDVLGDIGDLNGYVGKQWLALYAERNEAYDPILADSFKFSDKEQVPAGYDKGIHMFGSTAAENLNNPTYVWKSDAPKVYVYFKVDKDAANVTGSGFNAGYIGISALGGVLVGTIATAVCMTSVNKKKKKTADA